MFGVRNTFRNGTYDTCYCNRNDNTTSDNDTNDDDNNDNNSDTNNIDNDTNNNKEEA